jgi:hypothetical protein
MSGRFEIREAIDDEARNEVARDLCDNNMFGGEDLIRRLGLASQADRRR